MAVTIEIINHPPSPTHRLVKAISRGRVYAVTFAEPFPTVEEAGSSGARSARPSGPMMRPRGAISRSTRTDAGALQGAPTRAQHCISDCHAKRFCNRFVHATRHNLTVLPPPGRKRSFVQRVRTVGRSRLGGNIVIGVRRLQTRIKHDTSRTGRSFQATGKVPYDREYPLLEASASRAGILVKARR
jgi:hypothetical protein